MQPRNLATLFDMQAARLGPATALRARHLGLFRDLSWSEYRERVWAAAASLIDAGIQPGDRVGLLAENSIDWLVADMAILTAAAVNVPPHAPLPARQVQYQLADAEVRWLFLSNAEQLAKVDEIREDLPELRGVVIFDPHCQHDRASGRSQKKPFDRSRGRAGSVASWRGFLQRGRSLLPKLREEISRRITTFGPDDLATVMYTSGTTGNPKGVMLTHGNLLTNAVASSEASCRGPDSILFNWLPFSHIYARTVDHYLSIAGGATLCLAENVDTIVADLMAIQPTHMSSVPRFYEKILSSLAGLESSVARKKLHAIFGPRIRWLGSGGAPLPLHVAKAYQEHGLLLLQGYGLTESSPVISFNRMESYKLDSVGQAIPGVEIKIADAGEVLTRGPLVMKGYWKNPAATAEAIKDGWLHTGDLGRLDEEGFLFITGRKKELLVLSSGKKIVPNQVEAAILADPCIDQVVVVGEGRNFLSALLVPNWCNLEKEAGIRGAPGELCRCEKVRRFVERRLSERLKDLAPWERVKKFILAAEAFSVAKDELTVSLKLRRGVIFEHYRDALEKLYEPEVKSGK